MAKARRTAPRPAASRFARETREAAAARLASIFDALDRELPEARIALDFGNELELLVCVMLSAQCTDARVNEVTPALFRRCRTARDYAEATPEELEPYIQRLGLYRSKAKNLVACGRALVERHGGELPRSREALEELPGVGWKTAGVVALHAWDVPAFPVDTHVGRLARRMGFTRETDPDEVEAALTRLLPADRWGRAHQLLVWHGRRTCAAREPACDRCSVAESCAKRV